MTNADSNPFPGATSLSNTHPVFGRDEEIAKIRSLLLTERVVVLHGVSGSGKSSVLAAKRGLRDRFSTAEQGFSVFGLAAMRLPSEQGNGENVYVRTLIDGLRKEETDVEDSDAEQIRELMDIELLLLRHRQRHGSHHQLLIIDQFEEVFTKFPHDHAGRDEFFATLGEFVENNRNVRVLIAMRDEYLGELDRFRRVIPGRFSATFRLELLPRPMAVSAIEKTALFHESHIELCRKHVENLVDNLSAQGKSEASGESKGRQSYLVEPLFLQLACRDAWPDIHKRALEQRKDPSAKDTCVPFSENLSVAELDAVLRRFYEKAILSGIADKPEDEAKRRLFIHDGLVSVSGLRTMIGLERAERVWGLTAEDIKTLVDEHLVRKQQLNQLIYYELAHDRLVRPSQESNVVWLESQPAWRRGARNWQLHGSQKYRMLVTEYLMVSLAKRKFGALLPYELKWLEQQKRYRWLQATRALFVVTTLFVLLAAWYKVVELRGKRDSLRNNIADLTRNIAVLTEDYDNRQKGLEGELKIEQDRSTVLRLLNSYTQRKWVERRDQLAILQVSEAYAEMKRRFPERDDHEWAAGAFFSAFDNALKPLRDVPGLSRTVPVAPGRDRPIALHAGTPPKMAYLDGENGCIELRTLGTDWEKATCIYEPSGKVRSMDFGPAGHRLAVVTDDSLILLNVDVNLHSDAKIEPGFTIGLERPIGALAFTADRQWMIYSQDRQVTVRCEANNWAICSQWNVSINRTDEPIVQLGVGEWPDGRRLLATGGNYGSVEVFEMSAGSRAVSGSSSIAVEQLGEIPPPERKYAPNVRDEREVISLGFLETETPGLVIVHKDTQVLLAGLTPVTEKLEVVPIGADSGGARSGGRLEADNEHFQVAIFEPGGNLHTVLEDQITTWDLSGATVENPVARLNRWKTEARELRQLVVDEEWLIGQGFFYSWAWERKVSPESKLLRATLPVAREFQDDDLIFYPQSLRFGTGETILSGSSQHGLTTWDPKNGGWESNRFDDVKCAEGASKSIRALAVSPNRDLVGLAMGRTTTGAGQFALVSARDPAKKHFCDKETHEDGLWSIAFNGDGEWVATGDWKGRLAIWKVQDGNRISLHEKLELMEPGEPGSLAVVRAVAFHPTFDLLVAGKGSGQVVPYTIEANGRVLRGANLEFSSSSIGRILDIGFSYDGQWLAAAGAAGPVQLWKLTEGDDGGPRLIPELLLPGHPGGTRTIAFHPTHDFLASGGADGAVRITRVGRSEETPTILLGVDADVLSVAWNQQGTELAVSYKHPRIQQGSGSTARLEHGAMTIWSWDLEDISRIACRSVWRGLDREEWDRVIEPVSNRAFDSDKLACSEASL